MNKVTSGKIWSRTETYIGDMRRSHKTNRYNKRRLQQYVCTLV